jgi:ribosomal protein S18 acetylase RimI-like enzyme
LRRDRRLFLLAWDNSRLVGSLIGGWDGWRASMARLAVDPAYRRRLDSDVVRFVKDLP